MANIDFIILKMLFIFCLLSIIYLIIWRRNCIKKEKVKRQQDSINDIKQQAELMTYKTIARCQLLLIEKEKRKVKQQRKAEKQTKENMIEARLTELERMCSCGKD